MNVELARLIAAQVCLHASMAGLRMAAPLLALQQGYSAAAVGLLLALFALSQVILALPSGRYTDRHGLRRPVGVAVTAAVLGAGLAAAFPWFPVLCLAALLTGGATGVAVIALQRHVGRSATDAMQLRQRFSFLSMGPSFSNFLGPVLAGLTIDLAGYRTAFLLLALLPLASWYWIRPVRELPPVEVDRNADSGQAWTLLRQPMMKRLLVVNWLLSSCWDVHTFLVPLIGHERNFSATTIGMILGGFAIAATLTRLLLPAIARHLREWTVVAGAMLATCLIFAVYPLLASAWAMGICSALLGVALGSVQPMIMTTLHQITPAHRHGEALGLRMMVINASSVAMPIMFGALGATVGVSAVFWFVGAAVGSGSRLAWTANRRSESS